MRLARHQAVVPRNHNGTTNYSSFGTAPGMNGAPMTLCAYIRNNAITNLTFAGLYGKTPASGFGPRWAIYEDSGTKMYFGGHSSGLNGAPSSQASVGYVTTGSRQFVAVSWTGEIQASTIKFYVGKGSNVVATTTVSPVDGVTAFSDGAVGNVMVIGGLNGGTSPFSGDLYYLAKWNRVLSQDEVNVAYICGPQAVPGLVFFYVNGVDLGPYHLQPTNAGAALAFTNSGNVPSPYLAKLWAGRMHVWEDDRYGALTYTDPGESWSAAGTNAIAGAAAIQESAAGYLIEGDVLVSGSMGYVDPGENWVMSSQTLLTFDWTDPGESWDIRAQAAITGNPVRETLTRATTRSGREAVRLAGSAARKTLSGSGGTVRETIRDTNE